jgi:hypothetical protein
LQMWQLMCKADVRPTESKTGSRSFLDEFVVAPRQRGSHGSQDSLSHILPDRSEIIRTQWSVEELYVEDATLLQPPNLEDSAPAGQSDISEAILPNRVSSPDEMNGRLSEAALESSRSSSFVRAAQELICLAFLCCSG